MKLKKTLLSAALLSTLALSYPAIAQEDAAQEEAAQEEAAPAEPEGIMDYLAQLIAKKLQLNDQNTVCRRGSGTSVLSFRSFDGNLCVNTLQNAILAICEGWKCTDQNKCCASSDQKTGPNGMSCKNPHTGNYEQDQFNGSSCYKQFKAPLNKQAAHDAFCAQSVPSNPAMLTLYKAVCK